MKSYSQVKQDRWVLEILKHKKNGYFLDIGAYDGIHFSNSYLLEEEFLWNGLLVEANPVNYNLLLNNRPRSININVAISDKCGITVINNSSMSSKILSNNNQSNTEIEQITFKKLFEKYQVPTTIDYMSLDIEGYESKALSQFPFHSHICLTITVEHNLYLDGNTNKINIQNILLNNNYTLIKENVSCDNNPFEDWYIHKSIM
jgi:FkbM family methyltransferase